MNGAAAGLLPAFQRVRARIPRLGVPEYVAVLRALEGGFGVGSRAELVELCTMLWAKSPHEQRHVAEVLDAFLPAPRETPAPELPPPSPDRPAASSPDAPDGAASSPHAQAETAPAAPAAAPSAGGGAGEERWGAGLAAVPDVPVPRLPAILRFDMEPEPPVTYRQMSRAWRFYRRMGRRGVPVEVDAEATIARLYHDGVLAAPVLVPRRTNQARTLILEDTGGSMVPFRYATAALMEAAQHAGLARVDLRYFHDVPVDVVFHDRALLMPVALEDTVAPFTDAGILVYSDAGAARGGMDAVRVERTARLLEVLRRVTPAVAWLNPVPRHRWAGTTAERIRGECGVPMFALDRDGLLAAVDELRGRAR